MGGIDRVSEDLEDDNGLDLPRRFDLRARKARKARIVEPHHVTELNEDLSRWDQVPDWLADKPRANVVPNSRFYLSSVRMAFGLLGCLAALLVITAVHFHPWSTNKKATVATSYEPPKVDTEAQQAAAAAVTDLGALLGATRLAPSLDRLDSLFGLGINATLPPDSTLLSVSTLGQNAAHIGADGGWMFAAASEPGPTTATWNITLQSAAPAQDTANLISQTMTGRQGSPQQVDANGVVTLGFGPTVNESNTSVAIVVSPKATGGSTILLARSTQTDPNSPPSLAGAAHAWALVFPMPATFVPVQLQAQTNASLPLPLPEMTALWLAPADQFDNVVAYLKTINLDGSGFRALADDDSDNAASDADGVRTYRRALAAGTLPAFAEARLDSQEPDAGVQIRVVIQSSCPAPASGGTLSGSQVACS